MGLGQFDLSVVFLKIHLLKIGTFQLSTLVINRVINNAKNVPLTNEYNSSSNGEIYQLMLPCQQDKGSNLLKLMKRYVNKLLPEHTKLEITFTGTKLNSCFPLKDKTSFEHQHDLVYINCTEPSCCDNYIGEIDCRIIERIKYHSSRDYPSHLVKHNVETSHTADVNNGHFKIIDMNFSNNKKKCKIADSLWIKDLRPTLNLCFHI